MSNTPQATSETVSIDDSLNTRLSTALIEYPWQNGIALKSGKMAPEIKAWISRGDHESLKGIDNGLLLSLAEGIDNSDLKHGSGNRRLIAISDFLCSDKQKLCDASHWMKYSPLDIMAAAQIVIRHSLMDQLANAVGFPATAQNMQVPTTSDFTGPPKLLSILKRILQDWTEPVVKFKSRFQGHSISQEASDCESSAVVKIDFANLARNSGETPAQASLQSDLSILHRAMMHSENSDYHQTMVNLELLAFGVGWFGQGHAKFPETPIDFADALRSRATQVGLQIPPEFTQAFTHQEGRILFDRLRNCFHLSTTLSPLLALQPKKYGGDSIRRDYLLSAAHAVCNIKPRQLQLTEQALWRAILRVASGSSTNTEMAAFLNEYDKIQSMEFGGEDKVEWEKWSRNNFSKPLQKKLLAAPDILLSNDVGTISSSDTLSEVGTPTQIPQPTNTMPSHQSQFTNPSSSTPIPGSPMQSVVENNADIEQTSMSTTNNTVDTSTGQAGIVNTAEEESSDANFYASADEIVDGPAVVRTTALTPALGSPMHPGQSGGTSHSPHANVLESCDEAAVVEGPAAVRATAPTPAHGSPMQSGQNSGTSHSPNANVLESCDEAAVVEGPAVVRATALGSPMQPVQSSGTNQSALDTMWTLETFMNETNSDETEDPIRCPRTPEYRGMPNAKYVSPKTPLVPFVGSSAKRTPRQSPQGIDTALLRSGSPTLRRVSNDDDETDILPTMPIVSSKRSHNEGVAMEVDQRPIRQQVSRESSPLSPTSSVESESEENLMEGLGREKKKKKGSRHVVTSSSQRKGRKSSVHYGESTEDDRNGKIRQNDDTVDSEALRPEEGPLETEITVSQNRKSRRPADDQAFRSGQSRKGKEKSVINIVPHEETEEMIVDKDDSEQSADDGDSDEPQHSIPRKPSSPSPQRIPMATKPLVTGSKKIKMSLMGDLPGECLTTPERPAREIPEMAHGKFKVEMFDVDPNAPMKTVEFTTHVNVAELEGQVLSNVCAAVQETYVNGRPRYHLPSARSLKNDPDASSIFIVDFETFIGLSPQQIQDVFRERHILVENVPARRHEWSRESLSMVGSLVQRREIQVGMTRGDENIPGMLEIGTLDDIFVSSQNTERPRILNALSLPMGNAAVPAPPNFGDLASDQFAWLQTRGMPGFKTERPLMDDLIWGTAATANAISWIHMDTAGFGTSVMVATGSKYWVVYRRDRQLSSDNPQGNLGSAEARAENWDDHEVKGYYEAEAVILDPGKVFFMRPNTPHYVWSMEHSITLGRHFYTTSTIQDSCYQIIHSLVMHYHITNADHADTRSLIRRMLSTWVNFYTKESAKTGITRSVHIPDVSEPQGLLDFIAVGIIIELTSALEHGSYNGNAEITSKDEKEVAQTQYRIFMRWFTNNYCLFIDNKWLVGVYIFKRRLVDFAATVLHYKRVHHEDGSPVSGFTAKAMHRRLKQHFIKYWPELVPSLACAIDKPSPFMYWTGGILKIRPRTNCLVSQLETLRFVENSDSSENPIYIPDEKGPSHNPGPSRKRPRSPPAAPNNPLGSPASRELKRIKDAGGLRKISQHS